MQDIDIVNSSNSTINQVEESLRPLQLHIENHNFKEGHYKADLNGLLNLEITGQDRSGKKFNSIDEVWSTVLDLPNA